MVQLLRSSKARSDQLKSQARGDTAAKLLAETKVSGLEAQLASTVAYSLELTNKVGKGEADISAIRAAAMGEERAKGEKTLEEVKAKGEKALEEEKLQHDKVMQTFATSRSDERKFAQTARDHEVTTLRNTHLQTVQGLKDAHLQTLQSEQTMHLADLSAERVTHVQELGAVNLRLEAKCRKILVVSRAHYDRLAAKVFTAHRQETRVKDNFIRSLQSQLTNVQRQNRTYSEGATDMNRRNQEAMYQLMWHSTEAGRQGAAPSITGALQETVDTGSPGQPAHQEGGMLQITDETPPEQEEFVPTD